MYFCTLESGRAVEMKVVCHLSLTVVVKTPAEIDDHSRTSLTETAALKSKHTLMLLIWLLKTHFSLKKDRTILMIGLSNPTATLAN